MAEETRTGAGSSIGSWTPRSPGIRRCSTNRCARQARSIRTESADGGLVVVTGRAVEEDVLRHPEIFSSVGNSGQMGSERPAIPIELDPPEQRQYRKVIDPLFAAPAAASPRGSDREAGERSDR